jgi:hypothetical protein
VKLTELAIVGAFAVTVAYALVTLPLDSLVSFNPVEWLADSINGFLNMLEDLFFGWLPF